MIESSWIGTYIYFRSLKEDLLTLYIPKVRKFVNLNLIIVILNI